MIYPRRLPNNFSRFLFTERSNLPYSIYCANGITALRESRNGPPNGTMFVDLDWPLNLSRRLSASAELLVTRATRSIARYIYGDVAGKLAGWLGGWVSDTRRYCIKTAKRILKLFQPSVSPIILVSSASASMPNSKGNPFIGALNTQWVGKMAIFVRFSTEIAVYLGNGAR